MVSGHEDTERESVLGVGRPISTSMLWRLSSETCVSQQFSTCRNSLDMGRNTSQRVFYHSRTDTDCHGSRHGYDSFFIRFNSVLESFDLT